LVNTFTDKLNFYPASLLYFFFSERISLQPSYTIEKCRKIRGKENVCLLTTHDGRMLYLAADDPKIFHLLVFFVQTQTRLREELERERRLSILCFASNHSIAEECFVVRPETSEDQRRLGARGSMCFLHVSQWGLTLALQVSLLVKSHFRCKLLFTALKMCAGTMAIELHQEF
jgi:hypothetical protein